jgi:hypothetical protein
MSVYLIRIYDRSWGFRVVAVVHRDEESALQACHDRYGSHSGERNKRGFAEIVDQCLSDVVGDMATLEFQE